MGWGWIAIGIAIAAIILVLSFIRLKHFKYRIIAVVLILFLLFIYLSFTGVVKNNSLSLNSPSGIFQATKAYFVWIGNAFTNIKQTTGNVIRFADNSGITGAVKNTTQKISSSTIMRG
jgi:hypothetical protein